MIGLAGCKQEQADLTSPGQIPSPIAPEPVVGSGNLIISRGEALASQAGTADQAKQTTESISGKSALVR